jgi:hypothetical protein
MNYELLFSLSSEYLTWIDTLKLLLLNRGIRDYVRMRPSFSR